MKIQGIRSYEERKINFKGKRVDKNIVSQLSKNNPYSLTEPNQRNITNAISRLGKVKGAKNINFLLDTAAKSTYSTNIVLKNAPKNNWRNLLLSAALTAISLTPFISKQIKEKIAKLSEPQDLLPIEEQILNLRDQLLASIDLKQIEKAASTTTKEFEKNLDYLIISSETTLEHKKYILERLNYFMSDDYKINPQLADKKSIALAEMVNDMTISRPDAKVPNIKAVNQKQHGMCAAISIVRKKLAYEDKPNYVDSIISELDDSDSISVYDRSALGSGKKVKVQKVPVDFDTALAKGYRIIDASTMHWMQIAQMTGASNIAFNEYIPFDKLNFDVRTDSFFNVKTADDEIAKSQEYYQALVKAQSEIERYKASQIKKEERNKNIYDNFDNNIEELGRILSLVKQKLGAFLPQLSTKEIQEITSELLKLEYSASPKLPKNNPFAFISNEESNIKVEKIKKYIATKTNSNISDKEIEEIFSLIEYYNSVSANTEKQTSGTFIRKAQRLYDIAAAYRMQVITGINEKETREAFMTSENIPDAEYLTLETIDTLINKINTNSGHTDLIIEQLAPAVGQYGEVNKENTLDYLVSLKDLLQRLLTANIDDVYQKIALGNRANVYALGLNNLIQRAENCSKEEINHFSKILKCKNDRKAVINNFTKLAEELANNTENEDVLKKVGNIMGSPIELLVNNFKGLIEEINTGNNPELLQAFLANNGLENANDPKAFQAALIGIQDDINIIGTTFSEYAKTLRIVDKDGDILYSANPQEVLIKRLEDKNFMASAKNLRELQEHLNKIIKDRSTDEFGIMRGKLHDKSLAKFSKNEKKLLKDTEESIDYMYSYIQKQLNEVQSDLKPMLEELKRVIGLNNGKYWVSREGSSGASTEKEIRMLEYMTGRPHYSTENHKEAFEKIKNSPYSGISGTFVSHNEPGAHAQYIVDIAPVKVKTKDEHGNIIEEEKEVLFHDNTWGIAEKENTWIDSQGLLRTDYNSNRGGTLGYITNDKYWNGNLVDRILNEMMFEETPDTTENRVYKRIVHNDPTDSYKTMQYMDTILDGRSPEAKNISDKIHDLMFAPNTRLVENIKEIAKNYSTEEIKALLKETKGAGKSWKSEYETLKKRIFPAFGDGIKSLEDYNKLADDDYLKVVLEKMAIKEAYQIAGLETDLAEVRTVKDLSKFKAAQKTRALNSFKYSFGKDHMLMAHLAKNFGEVESFEFYAILDKYGIQLDEEGLDLLSGLGFALDDFTGSVKDMINVSVEEFGKDIDSLFDNPEAKAELQEHLRKYLTKNAYFNKKDLENKKIQHLVKFIDREFDPADDAEFVRIFRKIQDMTTEEFKKEIIPRVKPEDMGMKVTSGYEILKSIQRYEEKANRDFMNTVYFDNLATETSTKDYVIEYKRDKLTRKPKYLSKFDKIQPIYRELSYDLQLLTLPKLFNKYKDRNLEKYGAYPAYPKVDNLNENVLETSFNSTMDSLGGIISNITTITNQEIAYDINKRLKQLAKNMKADTVLSEEQRNIITTNLTEFSVLNYNNESYMEIFEAIDNVIDLPEGATWKDCANDIKKIIKRLNEVEATAPRKFLKESKEKFLKSIDMHIQSFAKSIISKRYQNKAVEMLNDIKQEMIKGNEVKIEETKAKFFEFYEKAHILNNPEELLETYIESCAKDSDLKPYQSAYEIYLNRSLQYAQLAEMQDTLMEAISEGVALSAKNLFNTHTIEMKDGTSLLMGSDEMITTMIHRLLLNENQETAQLFVEKLGLAESYINHITKNLDIKGLKEVIIEAHEVSQNYGKFRATIDPYISEAAKLINIDNSANKIISSLKKLIKEAGETYEIPKEQVVILLKALDNVKYNIKESPRSDKELLFNSYMSVAQNDVTKAVQQQLDLSNEVMKSNANLIIFIGNIILDENSQAHKARTKLIEKYGEVIALHKQLNTPDLQETETSDTI